MSDVPIAHKSPHVPYQYLGYSLQQTRFLTRLLTSDEDSKVSLEVFEDVGVENDEGLRFAEHVKSTHNGNPISDHSVEFWKTLANWVNATVSDELDANKTAFEIYVSVKRTGVIAESFSKARSSDQARRALREAKRELWGSAPTYENRASVSMDLSPYLERVFLADESIVCRIIQSFDLAFGSGSPLEDLRALFSKSVIPPEILKDALEYSHGWVKEKTDRLIEQGLPASVSVEEFHIALIAFVRKHDNRRILSSVARKPTQEAINTELNFRNYVNQLVLIECNEESKLEAVSDYLRASADRTHWSVQGSVDSDSFDEFEETLVRAWKNIKSKTEIEHSEVQEIKRGQFLYAECSLHHAMLEGLEVPLYFIPGRLHALADVLTIGWHPNYLRLLALQKKA